MVFLWFSYGYGQVPPFFIARQESTTPWAPAAPPPATPEKSVCPEGCGLAAVVTSWGFMGFWWALMDICWDGYIYIYILCFIISYILYYILFYFILLLLNYIILFFMLLYFILLYIFLVLYFILLLNKYIYIYTLLVYIVLLYYNIFNFYI